MTRIDIPMELPSPHFEDEATIVSARPVVPIARARVTDRSRMLLWLAPILSAAAVFGAVGALSVNYFERGRPGSGASPSQVVQQPQAEQAPVLQPSIEANAGVEPVREAVENSTSPVGEMPALPKADAGSIARAKVAAAVVRLSQAPSEPSRLVRKRVIAVSQRRAPRRQNTTRPARSNNRGAGRIREIFEGPNP